MISLKKKLFKKAIFQVITNGQFNAELPRSTFIKTVICFKKIGGAVFLRQSLVGVDYSEWEELFLEITEELGMEVKPGILGKIKVLKSPVIMKGAQRADFRHRQMLGDDY